MPTDTIVQPVPPSQPAAMPASPYMMPAPAGLAQIPVEFFNRMHSAGYSRQAINRAQYWIEESPVDSAILWILENIQFNQRMVARADNSPSESLDWRRMLLQARIIHRILVQFRDDWHAIQAQYQYSPAMPAAMPAPVSPAACGCNGCNPAPAGPVSPEDADPQADLFVMEYMPAPVDPVEVAAAAWRQDNGTCAHCGCTRRRDDGIYTDPNGDDICDDCECDLVSHCEDCHEGCWSDDATTVEYQDDRGRNQCRTVCDDCLNSNYTRCDHCSDYTPDDQIYGGVCRPCYEDHYFTCEGCGTVASLDFACSTDDGCYCEGCAPDTTDDDDDDGPGRHSYTHGAYSNSGRAIHPYSYKPAPQFAGAGPLFLGLEVEIECPGAMARQAAAECATDAAGGRLYCKDDGSLTSGVELVWHPASLDWWTGARHAAGGRGSGAGAGAGMVDRLAFTQILRDGGCRSYKTSTCGLHIHTPKSAWTALALYKAMEFFRRNVDLITLIACRDGGNWASIESDHHEIKYRCKSKTGGARYRAINLTNSATVEFRIFRGTLAPEGIFRCLEFVDCFWRFCNAAGLSELTPGAFLVFLARNRRQYPNLAQFIARKMPVEFALRGGMPAGPVAPGAMAPAVELQAPAVEREIAQCV